MTTLDDLERDLGPWLRTAYHTQMPTWERTDDQISSVGGRGSGDSRPPRSRFVLGVAAGLVAVLGAGMIWASERKADNGRTVEPSQEPTAVDVVDSATVAFVEDQTWYIPTELPVGFESPTASYSTRRFEQFLTYHDAAGHGSITVAWSTGIHGRAATEPRGEIDVGGVMWKVFDGRRDEQEAYTFENGVDDAWLAVNTIGVSYDEALDVVRSLHLQPSTALDRPPLPTDSGDGVIVAQASIDGTDWTLRAHTDGEAFVFETFDDDGHMTASPQPLLDDEPVQLLYLVGPDPDGARVVLIGAARSDVGSVVVDFTDGSSITVEPVAAEPFDERFFIAAAPPLTLASRDTILDAIAAITAFDNDQHVLARTEQPFGT